MGPMRDRKVAADQSSPPPYSEAGVAYRVPPLRLRKLRRLVLRAVPAVALICVAGWLWAQLRSSGLATVPFGGTALSASQLQHGLRQCAALRAQQQRPPHAGSADRTSNPRWSAENGQEETIVLRNANLFDGESFVSGLVDIVFEKGLITAVTAAGSFQPELLDGVAATEIDLNGQFVTPGLIDMHSHHSALIWPTLDTTDDTNEMHPDFGPLTPFARVLDGMKSKDQSLVNIASGGVTSSLILPGSANIIGGEAVPIKNRMRPGAHKEYVVEDILLEHGIPAEDRHRYMKLACGENPKGTYGHTRMGNVYLLRKLLARAQELLEEQDAWCAAATSATATKFPESVELESTVALLRGQVSPHIHCYESSDIETMLRVSHEFGFRVRAFHHALSAWQVPELLKEQGENITIATFAEFGLYKMEASQANLYAGKILVEHGIPLAFKSDQSSSPLSAKYLLNQAAVAHSFGVPVDYALRSLTSVPAKAIDLDHRIGYARAGYDADIVVWDSHPLSIGATPRQVFVDGVAVLDPAKVKESMDDQVRKGNSTAARSAQVAQSVDIQMRPTVSHAEKNEFCDNASKKGQTIIITGIQTSFLENTALLEGIDDETAHMPENANLTLVIAGGKVSCLGHSSQCDSQIAAAETSRTTKINLSAGYISPGLTAVTQKLGMVEVDMVPETGDGVVSPFLDPSVKGHVNHAKYGVILDGKPFKRARIGGITRAITPPLTSGGLVRGVSTGILTSGKRKLINGGIFQDDVAIHVDLGDLAKTSYGAISLAIQELRRLLLLAGQGTIQDTRSTTGDEAAVVDSFMFAVKGQLPLVVFAKSLHDIEQVILLKRELSQKESFRSLKIVLYGGDGAPHVARELAEADIPVILTANRGSIAEWATLDSLPGPPLSRSPASILTEAGVKFAIAIEGQTPEFESRIHDLALEASWAAKYAGLSDLEAIRLVSRNVEDILGLEPSGDVVVWEGNPLQFGSRPVLAFQEVQDMMGSTTERFVELATCWPDEGDE
ncbi:hypothetical protein BX600DRAFT_524683 [Xylariales sp. PMI_506]|nr:hypothetical protein BX600DRAFT_524683 [Xylariales sp. PMI_506]